eukprot:4561435-Pyramimonas_sp.AAC.1
MFVRRAEPARARASASLGGASAGGTSAGRRTSKGGPATQESSRLGELGPRFGTWRGVFGAV